MGRIKDTKAANAVRATMRGVVEKALVDAGYEVALTKDGFAVVENGYVVIVNATVKAEDFDLNAAVADKEATEVRKAEKAEAAAEKKAEKAAKAAAKA